MGNSVTHAELRSKRDKEMADLRAALREDFDKGRVNHGARTRYVLARVLLLDELLDSKLELEG